MLHWLKDLANLIVQHGYGLMALVVFTETGLLVGFFLPGDTLLFVAGMACVPDGQFVHDMLNGHALDLLTVNLWLVPAAIIGDTVGYWIGYKLGAPLYSREKTLFFRKDHLLVTRDFYDQHGGKTIVLARFAPILRTFAPVVAGIAQMSYWRFVAYNVCGGAAWVIGLTYLGYRLASVTWVKDNLDAALILIAFVSLLPAIVTFWKSRKKPAAPETPAAK